MFRIAIVAALALMSGSEAVHLQRGKAGRLAETEGKPRVPRVKSKRGGVKKTGGRMRLAETEGRRLAQGRGFRLAELLATKGPSADDIMEMFDHNGDGEIGKEEFLDQLGEIARDHDYEPTEDDRDMAMKMFRMADQDKSGSVSREELLDAMEAMDD